MKYTQYILSAVLVILCSVSYAQDKIYMHNHDIISAKVKNVSADQVTYKRWDNQEGPDYTVFTADVIKIMYADGSQDIMNERAARKMSDNPNLSTEKESIAKLRNFIYLAPIEFTENGFGFSVAYERYLDKTGIFKFYLPLIVSFNVANNSYTDVSGNQVIREDPMFYAMPGFKVRVYQQESHAIFIGTSVVAAEGSKTVDSTAYSNYGTSTRYATGTQNKFLFGMMGHASADIFLKSRVYFNVELGFGWTYIYTLNNVPQNNSGLLELGFKIGYRY